MLVKLRNKLDIIKYFNEKFSNELDYMKESSIYDHGISFAEFNPVEVLNNKPLGKAFRKIKKKNYFLFCYYFTLILRDFDGLFSYVKEKNTQIPELVGILSGMYGIVNPDFLLEASTFYTKLNENSETDFKNLTNYLIFELFDFCYQNSSQSSLIYFCHKNAKVYSDNYKFRLKNTNHTLFYSYKECLKYSSAKFMSYVGN